MQFRGPPARRTLQMRALLPARQCGFVADGVPLPDQIGEIGEGNFTNTESGQSSTVALPALVSILTLGAMGGRMLVPVPSVKFTS